MLGFQKVNPFVWGRAEVSSARHGYGNSATAVGSTSARPRPQHWTPDKSEDLRENPLQFITAETISRSPSPVIACHQNRSFFGSRRGPAPENELDAQLP